MEENIIREIAQYCARNIYDYDLKVETALRYIGRHYPLDPDFRNEIENCASEWADENEYSIDFIEGIDAEEIVLCPIDEDDPDSLSNEEKVAVLQHAIWQVIHWIEDETKKDDLANLDRKTLENLVESTYDYLKKFVTY